MLTRLNPRDLFEMNMPNANQPIGQTTPHGVPDSFVHVPARRFRLHHPKAVQSMWGPVQVSKVDTTGTGLDQFREFVWLPYIPGRVSYTALPPGLPILTGKMDGCWLVLFTMGGQNWFGHIGTELGPYTANSIRAKNAWTMALGTRAITCTGAFNPVSSPVTGDTTLGAVDANRGFQVVDCHRSFQTPGGQLGFLNNTYCVKGVLHANSVPRPQFT